MESKTTFTAVKLVATEGLSSLSSQLLFFVLPLIAITTLNATPSDVSWINTGIGLGTFIFLLLLGPLCDIKKTHLLLSYISMLRFILIFIAGYLLSKGQLNILTTSVIAFFIAGISAIYESAISSYTPKIIHKNNLHKINIWMGGLRTIADVATGAVSGILLSISSSYVTFFIIGLMFLISAIGPLTFHKKINDSNAQNNVGDLKYEFKNITHGVKLIFKNPIHKKINLSIVQFNLFTATLFSLYVIYSMKNGGMGVLDIGISGSIGGIIGLTGILISNKLSEVVGLKKIMALSLTLPGFFGLLILFIPDATSSIKVILLSLALGLWSVCILVNVSVFETYKQKTIPHQSLGRYSAASRCITWGVEPLGAFIAVMTSPYIPLNIIICFSLVGVMLSSIWIYLSDLPNIKISEL